jgi:glycosyltransferase involved in cell wall biosynthesis
MPRNKKKIILTVTNDLNYDQRMIRICTSLHEAGYEVELVGWQWSTSQPLQNRVFKQKRLPVPFRRGKMMYAIYWTKLFFYLLQKKADALCAIDLDTILPVYFASKLKGCKRVYDAHEIFTELQEVVTRPRMKKIWEWIGNFAVPKFPFGYTIGDKYADVFREKYGVQYAVVRNATVLRPFTIPPKTEKYILYQGAVNIGRCFEYLIPAMQWVNGKLIIVGEGNFYKDAQAITQQLNLGDKVIFKGYKKPEELRLYTEKAWIGITLFEVKGTSNLFSMANRFFDYMHHGVPQLCNAYPEYQMVNEQFEIATLINDVQPSTIATALNQMLEDDEHHRTMEQNALKAREVYCWQEEEKRLLAVYQQLFS